MYFVLLQEKQQPSFFLSSTSCEDPGPWGSGLWLCLPLENLLTRPTGRRCFSPREQISRFTSSTKSIKSLKDLVQRALKNLVSFVKPLMRIDALQMYAYISYVINILAIFSHEISFEKPHRQCGDSNLRHRCQSTALLSTRPSWKHDGLVDMRFFQMIFHE